MNKKIFLKFSNFVVKIEKCDFLPFTHFLNGQRLKAEEREIKEGDEIQIGNVRFVLA